MSVEIETSSLELNQDEVTAMADHRPEVDEQLPHHERPIRAVGDHLLCCNPVVCAVGDHVLPESKKNKWKNRLKPRSKNLL